ncbi:mandelate racemase/muconate lactonizing enzyme family protein, partial [Jatrophihabitans sp.]|uniref:mandelate racemase/muconate lactonizing enzyme family protein n=1 Tax=Jatrophihabitans sp. TaxID=1932789 RepID=UPI0030C71F0C|nr:L-alanine-DL-glutamate epimerase [Jatrophihabitans sp.]
MRLVELSCYAVDIPTQHEQYVMSHGRVLTSFPSTVVKVTAEDGTVGFGEACTLGNNYLDGFPASAQETVRLLADWVLACDPFAPGVLVDGMDHLVVGNLTGKAAIDIALWDLRGKLLGRPVADLLGGVKARSMPGFKAISLGTAEEMVDEVDEAAARGYRAWQLKLGDDPISDAARVRAVAAAIPTDSTFMTSDANKGWTVAQAIRFVNAIKDVDTYVEQPCPTVSELLRVRSATSLPIMVDESLKTETDALEVAGFGVADAINLKVVRVGGLTKAARVRDLARAAGWMILADEPQGADLATASLTHFAATIDPERLLATAYFMGEDMKISYQEPGATSGPRLVDGCVQYDDSPGLGIEIDERVFGEPLFTV